MIAEVVAVGAVAAAVLLSGAVQLAHFSFGHAGIQGVFLGSGSIRPKNYLDWEGSSGVLVIFCPWQPRVLLRLRR